MRFCMSPYYSVSYLHPGLAHPGARALTAFVWIACRVCQLWQSINARQSMMPNKHSTVQYLQGFLTARASNTAAWSVAQMHLSLTL